LEAEPMTDHNPSAGACEVARPSGARYIVGDVLDVLRAMPDASVDLVLSSPPFLALRSYLPADHPDKAKEIGSEPTPGAFIDTLLDVVEECRRVLAPHGSLCFELGDTYAGSGGAGGDYNADGLREGHPTFTGSALKARRKAGDYPDRDDHSRPNRNGRRSRPADEAAGILTPRGRPGPEGRDHVDGWPLDKSLCLVPELLRIAMVYGVNPLTGRATPRWRARNVVRWCRPNPPVGALGDKVRPATSDILVACVDRRRYFDLDAIRTPHKEAGHVQKARPSHNPHQGWDELPSSGAMNAGGAPPLDHWWFDEVDDLFPQDAWHVSTEPYKGSHYATWPTDLCVRPILAMCPAKVCTTCGKPSERIVERLNAVGMGTVRSWQPGHERAHTSTGMPDNSEHLTVGWTDCECSCGCCDAASCAGDKPGGCATKWRQGVVLDPFAGSGTTLLVALGHGRSAIGIDLDARNADLARDRVGMWLDVETHAPAQPRRLKGDECQCIPCGAVFEHEKAFRSHITRAGHVAPVTVGLVEKSHAGGAVWGLAG